MSVVQYDQVQVPVQGRFVCIIRFWINSEVVQGGSDSDSHSSAPVQKQVPYVVVQQVFKSILSCSNISLHQVRYIMKSKELSQIEANKAQLKFLREIKILQGNTGHAGCVSAEDMLHIFKELEVETDNFQRLVVQQEKQLALSPEALKIAIIDSISHVAMMPDSPIDISWEPNDEQLSVKQYILDAQFMTTSVECLLLRGQLFNFEKFLVDKVVLSREKKAVKGQTALDILKLIHKFIGFCHRWMHTPLDLRYLANGVLISKHVKFLVSRQAHAGEGGSMATAAAPAAANYRYSIRALGAIQNMLKWLKVVEPEKTAGLGALADQVASLKTQLRGISSTTEMDVGQLIAQGTAMPFDELSVFCSNYCNIIISKCSAPSLETALLVKDALMIMLLVGLPGQRAPTLNTLQVVKDIRHLFDPDGNYALLMQGGKWAIKWQVHKTAACLGTIILEHDNLLSQLLSQFVGWAEDMILCECLGCPPLNQTQGFAFLNRKGVNMSISSFYKNVTKILKVVCNKPDLNITVNVLRHLTADFIESHDMFAEHKEEVSMLAGHSHKTALTHYCSPQQKLATKSTALTKGANLFQRAQQELLVQQQPPAEPAPTSSGATISDSASLEILEEPAAKKPCLSLGARGQGKPAHHIKPAGVEYISASSFHSMSMVKRRAVFMEMYGEATSSSNTVWLFTKLTGKHKSHFDREK